MSIFIKKLDLTIDGKNYDSQYTYSDIRLNQELMKPNELRFHMTRNTPVEEETDMQANIAGQLLGKDIRFTLATHRDSENKTANRDVLKFNGIIFDVDVLREHMGYGHVLEVTAYSHDYLLQDSAHCNSYEKMNLQAIVSDVTSGCGDIPLSNNPMMGSDIPYTVQYNETNYEFLSRLAQRYGEWFYNDGSQLVFGSLEKQAGIELRPGFDILNYRYRMNMSHTKITHGCHNYLDYRNSQSTAAGSGGAHRLSGFATGASDSVYRKETFRAYRSSTAEENGLDETEHSTKAESRGKQGGMMTCRGRSNRCDLQIGSRIRIKEYYDDGTGGEKEYTHEDLLICGITHYAGNDGSYENEFLALDTDVEYPPYTYGDRYPQAEPQRAVVKDNKDPEQLGRVRVQFLWQQEQDDSQLTPWIRIAQPHGGGNKGFYFIPEIDEEVMVGFENGNAEKPYVTGTLYHGQAKPPGSWYNDEDNIKAIRTRSGHTIEFHDTEGEEYIKIYDNEKDNFILTFSTFERLIKLQSKGNIELYADEDIIMKAGKNINMEAEIDISSKAGKNIHETAGENNTIEIGKDRTITVGNNISETAGDNNTIEIGKDRTITVGNNISEKAGDNITIDVGKDRTITVGSNIEETAGANITLKAESNINGTAGSNVKVEAGSDVETSAGKNIGLSASDSIASSARKNFTAEAGKNIAMSATDDVMMDSGKKMNVSSGKDLELTVAKTLKTNVREDFYMDISKKSNFRANSIEQVSGKEMTINAGSTLKQKASSGIKIDGGLKVDIKAINAKIN